MSTNTSTVANDAFEPISVQEAPEIASCILHSAKHPEVEVAQVTHRIGLVNQWRIPPGASVLEIGCGQGNATAVLARAVGPRGSVDAIDPADPGYGAPYTLGESQAFICASSLGQAVRFHRAEPEEFLRSTAAAAAPQVWDFAVLAHSIWYFATPDVLGRLLRALRGRARRVCVAEHALAAREPAAVPHVLAALARGALESHLPPGASGENIRTPLAPADICRVARDEAGWRVVRGGAAGEEEEERDGGVTLVPGPGLLDGSWEVLTVQAQDFLDDVDRKVPDERARVVLRSARAAVIAAVKGLNGQKVRSMDVWVAQFEEMEGHGSTE